MRIQIISVCVMSAGILLGAYRVEATPRAPEQDCMREFLSCTNAATQTPYPQGVEAMQRCNRQLSQCSTNTAGDDSDDRPSSSPNWRDLPETDVIEDDDRHFEPFVRPSTPSSSARAANGKTYVPSVNECISIKGNSFLNTCSFTVSITWCYVSSDGFADTCDNGFSGDVTIGAGKKWPVNPGGTFRSVEYVACRGAYTLSASFEDSRNKRTKCEAP